MYPFDTRCGAVLCWVRVYCKSACCFFCDSHMNIFLNILYNRMNS